MEALQKLQNSIQILIILWPVYPIHTNSLFWVIFEELPFCHFRPPNTSIRGLVDLSFEHISFSNKRKTTILFPSPLTFLQWPMSCTLEPAIWSRETSQQIPCFDRCQSTVLKKMAADLQVFFVFFIRSFRVLGRKAL